MLWLLLPRAMYDLKRIERRIKMTIVKEGRSSYGYCYIADYGTYFQVVIGGNVRGPFSSFADALREFSMYCAT